MKKEYEVMFSLVTHMLKHSKRNINLYTDVLFDKLYVFVNNHSNKDVGTLVDCALCSIINNYDDNYGVPYVGRSIELLIHNLVEEDYFVRYDSKNLKHHHYSFHRKMYDEKVFSIQAIYSNGSMMIRIFNNNDNCIISESLKLDLVYFLNQKCYSQDQLIEIQLGLNSGIDVMKYANKTNSPTTMRNIRLELENELK